MSAYYAAVLSHPFDRAIAGILQEAAEKNGVPDGSISFIDRAERRSGQSFAHPRPIYRRNYSEGRRIADDTIAELSTIPVIKHDRGVCHIFVDADADSAMAERICLNAKVQRPSTCNALETLLVHQNIAKNWLPALVHKLTQAGVEIRGCAKTCQLSPDVKPATEQDYGHEFLNLTLAVKVVKHMDEAMEHIANTVLVIPRQL